jgi:tripartite-type tricarboxylate transporter receptor subunit TctC
VEVNPSVPAKTVLDLIAYAKANPGKINFASAGIGTTHHMSAELFKMMSGVDIVHVPYRGTAAALTDLIGGRVQLMFDNIPTSIEFIRDGTIRDPFTIQFTHMPRGKIAHFAATFHYIDA